MGNVFRTMRSVATALPFGGFTTIPNPQYESQKINLCGYHHQNYFAIIVPEMDLFSKTYNRS